MRKLQISFILIFACIVSFDSFAQKQTFKTSFFMPYREKVLQLQPDSSHFISSDILKGNYPLFKKKNLGKVMVYSHCSERQLETVDPSNAADHLYMLTDSLAVVNREECPYNSADLSTADMDSLLQIFSNKKTFQRIRGGGSNCFFPRHTFLFLDYSGKVMGYLEVCFQCDMVLASPNLVKFEGNFKGDGEQRLKSICKRSGINLLDRTEQ
jgi:hypothetical protein